MTCITRQHIGKYTYLYESTSYRDQQGQPRNKKVRIGKIDPETGETIYDASYLEREKSTNEVGMANEKQKDKYHSDESSSSIEEILDCTKNFGSFYLFKALAREIGLLKLLKEIFPNEYKEIFILSCFLIETQEPLMYCNEWLSTTETFKDIRNLSSQFISKLLSRIAESDKINFFESWIKNISDSDYIALDITSISSYSELMDSCEWGYNRDKEKLPQINLCMLFGEECEFPVFFKDYPGSISDVSTLKTTISEIKQLAPNAKIHFVMDKGFYSKQNINTMIENNIEFLISVPFKDSFPLKLIESERKDIDLFKNTILTSDIAIRGVHKEKIWNNRKLKSTLHAHIYFNPIKAMKEKNELYAYITELRQEAIKNPENKDLLSEFNKYLIIRKSSKNKNGYTVNVSDDVIEKKLKTCGWLVLISNYIENTQYALDIYRRKDVVEKSFDRLKNSMDLNRLRIHSDRTMKNKLFISFISIIIISLLHKKMSESKLYKRYTMHELVLKLRRIKVAIVKKKYILQPITKEQREILLALSIPLPATGTEVSKEELDF